MICRMTGRVEATTETGVVLTVGPLSYEVLVPAAALVGLSALVGEEITLHTQQYLEGNAVASNFIPRTIGFLSAADREFFNELIKVKGLGMKKTLRSLALPTHQIATAIEHGDERLLASLPEIGKKTAAQLIVDLRGKLTRFRSAELGAIRSAPLRTLSSAQRIALDILVQWGDRRSDAERWVAAAVEGEPELAGPDEIVRAAYRAKQRG